MTLTLELPDCGASPIGRLDPRWKLAGMVPAGIVVALLRTAGPAVAALAGSWVLVLLLRLPLIWYGTRLAFAAVFLGLFLAFLPFLPDPHHEYIPLGSVSLSWDGLTRAFILLVRGLTLATLALVLLAGAPVHDTFKAARALHFPRLIVHLALLAYRYVFLLAEELGRLRTALRVRGFRNRPNMHSYRTIGQVAGTLLVRGHDRAERIGQAMRCRGFRGEFHSLHPFSTTWKDVFAWSVLMTCSAGLLVWDVWVRSGWSVELGQR